MAKTPGEDEQARSQAMFTDKRAAALFAADCAEQALPIFEAAYPNDDRPRKAIEAARSFVSVPVARAAALAAHAAARAAHENAAAAFAARAAEHAAATIHVAAHAKAAAVYADKARAALKRGEEDERLDTLEAELAEEDE